MKILSFETSNLSLTVLLKIGFAGVLCFTFNDIYPLKTGENMLLFKGYKSGLFFNVSFFFFKNEHLPFSAENGDTHSIIHVRVDHVAELATRFHVTITLFCRQMKIFKMKSENPKDP